MSGGTYSLKWNLNDRFLRSFSRQFLFTLCVHEWLDLQFKVDSGRQIFEKLFKANLFTLGFCQKTAERKSPKKYFLYFVLMCGLGHEARLYV